ncbi:MAG TPA: efflux RND transporter periplasmic adaptor subunit [bacterium]|nr:efflux RND transporter periplasmic adaptor subunit [bacterium]
MKRCLLLSILLLLALPLPPGALAAEAAVGPSVLIRTSAVTERTVAETVTAFGTIQPDPDRMLSLSVPHGGLVNRVWVRVGQRIGRGARLAELIANPTDRMQFLQAQSAVEFAQRELQRQQRLFSEHLATRAQVATAQKDLRDAQATLDSLRSQGKGQASLILRTPMDGIVTRIDVQAGQRVGTGSAAVLIAAEDKLVAVLGVEPENVSIIDAGVPVRLTSVFQPQFHLEAKVREVHAMIDPATQLVDVLVPLPADKLDHLVLGSHIEGHIRLHSHHGLTVPRRSVLRDGKGAYVFQVTSGKARRVDVQALLTGDDWVEVRGPLKVGDRIVTSGNYELQDGMAVREEAR